MPRAPSLPELQHAFAAALVDGGAPSLTLWIASRGIDPAARLAIYRNAGYAIHVEALEAVFPAVRALVGEACFDGLATRFTARRGSSNGNLQHFGLDFAGFLEAQPETASLVWLPDVARLEWLRQEAMLAAEAAAAASADLLGVLERVPAGSLRIELQPHVRVLRSAHPVLDLWTWALDPRGATPDPKASGQCVLLWRRGTRVRMQPLDGAHAAPLAAWCRGREAHDAAGPAVLAGCLAPLLEHALITRIVFTPAVQES